MPTKRRRQSNLSRLREIQLNIEPKFWPTVGKFKICEHTQDSHGGVIADEEYETLPKAREAARRLKADYGYLGDWWVFNDIGKCMYHIAD